MGGFFFAVVYGCLTATYERFFYSILKAGHFFFLDDGGFWGGGLVLMGLMVAAQHYLDCIRPAACLWGGSEQACT